MAIDDTDFSVHITTHLDERPFQCGYCEFSGFIKSSIQKHLANYHPGKEEIILDYKGPAGERIKVKQTMLVDFDPQINVEKIEKSSLNISQIRPGTWKIEREKIVEKKITDAASAETVAKETLDKTDTSKHQKKIEKLFSLQSKDQRKAIAASDSKEITRPYANVKPILSSPDSESVAHTEAQIDEESDTENIITENRSEIRTSSPPLKMAASEHKNNASTENISKDMVASQLLKTIPREIENRNNNSNKNNSEVMLSSTPLKSVPKEKENKKNEKRETKDEKRHSPICKTVSVKVPSPVKSSETKTVRLQIPSPIKDSKSVDEPFEDQDTGDIDMELPMFTGNTLVYGEERSQTENYMHVDNYGKGKTDDKTTQEKQNSTKTGKEKGLVEQEIKTGNDENQPGILRDENRNGAMNIKITDQDIQSTNADNGNVNASDMNNEQQSQKSSISSDISGGETSVSLEETLAKVTPKDSARASVNEENGFHGNVVSKNSLKNGDRSYEENITEQMETESIKESKTENEKEKQIDVCGLQTCKDQENDCSKEIEKRDVDSNREMELDSSKTSKLQDNIKHIEEQKFNESDKGKGTTNNASQGFEVFDESEAVSESEIAEHGNDIIQNVRQISESQPFVYDGEIDKETNEPRNEEMDYTKELCGKKDEHYFGKEKNDDKKLDESDIETLRCHPFNDEVSKTVSDELELDDINDIAPSRNDTVDGDNAKNEFGCYNKL